MKPVPHPLSGSAWRGLRVGLLGGSFNPAHEGHLHISLIALKRLRLHAVWWLVSPQNPLKSDKNMASFESRFKGAEQLTAPHRLLIVSDLEARLGTRFTADTLQKLRTHFPSTRFVWLMGADNLIQIPRWQRWAEIFLRSDVAVFRRPPYFVGAMNGKAAIRFKHQQIAENGAARLGNENEKHWVLFNNRLHSASATQIREGLKK